MQTRVIIAVVVVAALVLFVGTVTAETITNAGGSVYVNEMTLKINGVDYKSLNNPSFIWGDTIRFSGMNNISDSLHLSLGNPEEVIDWNPPRACKSLSWAVKGATLYPIITGPDKAWGYSWDSGDPKCKYPNVDTTLIMEVMGAGPSKYYTIKMKAIVIQTPSPTLPPTPTLTIAPAQTTVTPQPTVIKTTSEPVNLKIPVTTIPLTTTNYDEKIAAIEKEQATQKGMIDQIWEIINQILAFLGME